jgi:hypothetical protein
MNRWKAAGYHFALSLLVIFSIAALALLVWYPYGTYAISGVDRLFTVMLIIDITIGPVLTCIVYKQGKASLKKDLTVIALLQMMFLAYGLNTLWQSRPVFLVGSTARFNLVFANEISDEDLAKASRPEWKHLPVLSPSIVGVLPSNDPKERSDMLWRTLETGVDIHQLPELYIPLEDAAAEILRDARPTADPEIKEIAIVSRFDDATLLIDANSARPIRVVK